MPTALGYTYLREAGIESREHGGGRIDIAEDGSKVIFSLTLVMEF